MGIDANRDQLDGLVNDIQYTYDYDVKVFTADGKVQVSPTEMFDKMGDSFSGISSLLQMAGGIGVMSEMINNQELLDQQYELVGDGRWPEAPNEVVLVVGKNNRINTMALYMLGVLDQSELEDVMKELMLNGKYESNHGVEYDLDYFLNMEFYMVNEFQFYEENVGGPKYLDSYNTWSEIPLLTEE